MDASRKDDMVDENKDGIADVKQIRAHEVRTAPSLLCQSCRWYT